MAVEYITIDQRNPRNPDQIIRYPRAVSSGVVEMEEIIRELEMTSTLSGADITAALRGLTDITARKLAEGKTVRLGEMGTFRITLESKAQPGDAKVTEASIEKGKIAFAPDKLFKRMLNSLEFVKKKA